MTAELPLEQRILDILEPEPLAMHNMWRILDVSWGELTGALSTLKRKRKVSMFMRAYLESPIVVKGPRIIRDKDKERLEL